ncbi:MAG: YdeI/OmpD-associated family protein [Pseudomonadota bacterium]
MSYSTCGVNRHDAITRFMETRAGLPVLDFADLSGWESWLASQPDDAAGLWLKLAKPGNAASSLTKAQAIDGALCHGWIDGQIDKYDDAWFLTRFTPRARTSKWSEKNRNRAVQLIADGRVSPAGHARIDAAKAGGRWESAYAPASTATEPPDLRAALDANPQARAFFDTLTGANRYAILYRVQTAKRPETRAARIAKFVALCAAGETIH